MGRISGTVRHTPVTIIMPEFAMSNEEKAYMQAAERVAKGGSGALPYGSDVKYATEARGTNPFIDFLRHQQEHIVMLATGGLLTTLTAAGSGTLAGEAHTDTWRQIVARDIRLVARALNRRVTHDLLNAAFPGRPHLAQIEMDANPAPTAKAVFEDATAARASGYLIDKKDLENRTGYTLIEDKSASAGGFGATMFNTQGATPLQNHGMPLQNSRTEKDGVMDGRESQPQKEAFKAVPGDPLAAALEVLETGGDPESALDAYDAAAKERLQPEHIAATAEQIAVEMEEVAAEIFGVSNSVANAGTSEGASKGWDTRRRNGWTPEQLAANKQKVNSLVEDLGKIGPGGKGKGWKDREENLGTFSDEVVAEIKRANPRIKVEGAVATISTKQLSHALESHGAGREKKSNQLPITKEDLTKIPDVFSDYNSILPGKGPADGKPTEAIVFRKNYADGTIACVQVETYSGKLKTNTLKFQTMWKEKK